MTTTAETYADTRGRTRATALATCVLLAVLAWDIVGPLWFPDAGDNSRWFLLPLFSATLAPAVVGLLIVRQQPRNVIGWLLTVHAAFVAFCLDGQPSPVHNTVVAAISQAALGSWVLLYVCLVLIGYLFPTGRTLNRRWHRWLVFCLLGYASFLIGCEADVTSFHEQWPTTTPPLPHLPTVVATPLAVFGLVTVALSLLGTVVCARARVKMATGETRLQLLWFSWAALSIPLMLAMCWTDYWLFGDTGTLTFLAITVLGSIIPVAIGIAILRSNLFDIELVLSRTLTYGLLTAGVIGTYALTLRAVQAAFNDSNAGGLVATAIVAVAIQPVHGALRRRVERWVYGDRSDPTVALRKLSARVENAADPEAVVQTLTESIADALKIDRVWIDLERDPADRATADSSVRIPLSHRGVRLGDLAVEVPDGRQLSAADVRLLNDLARHASVVVAAVQLADDLQQSRAHLVTAREEERRRLRRDLHDGLGPSLAAIVLKLNAAQSRTRADERAELLSQAREETRAAITEVRRLVDDLRPPALDEVGLIGAIRQRAATLSHADGVSIDVSGPAVMPALPAAVEVAAYRIATEAMTNVVRHSAATHCLVHLAANGAFEVVISDNGRGARLGTSPGVGWTSMRARAAELGGSCTISARPEGGTVVRAVLPLASTESPQAAHLSGEVHDEVHGP